MYFLLTHILTIWISLITAAPTENFENGHVEFLMPDVQPKKADTYLCYGKKVTKDVYITGFEPHANMSTAHHMLLYGCTEPGKQENVWNCGEMSSSDPHDDNYKLGPTCGAGPQVIYAWAMDAPKLDLPEGVGFKVGPSTSVKYVVLQVHYKDVHNFLKPINAKDHSGIILKVETKPQPKRAGVYLLGTGGVLPPHSVEYFESACRINEDKIIHPFAFRTHAHTHGVLNSAYRVRDGKWKEIGRRSPQKPQMFYPVSSNMTIKKNDIIAMRCTMKNNDNAAVYIGLTQHDEMCNFYIMYYMDGDDTLDNPMCWSPGPPDWFLHNFEGLNANDIPRNASVLPDTGEYFPKTDNNNRDIDEDQDLADSRVVDSDQDLDDIKKLILKELEASKRRIYEKEQLDNEELLDKLYARYLMDQQDLDDYF